MTKILEVINKMIEEKEKITQVENLGAIFCFIYNDKYVWSIQQVEEHEFSLTFYPNENATASVISSLENGYNVSGVTYSNLDFKTREAEESFKDLYITVQEKRWGVDQVLDDILFSE